MLIFQVPNEDRFFLKNQRERCVLGDLGAMQFGSVDPKSARRLKRSYDESSGMKITLDQYHTKKTL